MVTFIDLGRAGTGPAFLTTAEEAELARAPRLARDGFGPQAPRRSNEETNQIR